MEKVGPYLLIGRLATGGMAEVFLARRDGPAGFEKVVVLKRILPQFAEDPEFRRMFLDEARLAALINHPNVVSIFELSSSRDALYIAMEYVPGFDLAKVMDASLKQRRLVPAAVAARIVADAAAGLDFAHRLTDAKGQPRSIVHRDISPENLLVSEVGQVKVVDFGIARASTGHQLSSSGRLKGKVHYHAPEHIQGQPLDGKADVYALGVVLYELLCARRPFEGLGELEVMKATVDQDPPHPSTYYPAAEPELSEIAMRAAARDPADRLNASELRHELELWLRRHPCSPADVERYLLEVVPSDSPERTRARKLLEDAPERELTNSGPHAYVTSSGFHPPGGEERTQRSLVHRASLRTVIPVALSVVLGFVLVSWVVTRAPAEPPHAEPAQPIAMPMPATQNEVPVEPTPAPTPAPTAVEPQLKPQQAHTVPRARQDRPAPSQGTLVIHGDAPRNTRVVVDAQVEKPWGREISLSPGLHSVRVVNEAVHLDASRPVQINAGDRKDLVWNFQAVPVEVKIGPWAYVTIDEGGTIESPKLVNKLALYEGKHHVRLKYPPMNGQGEVVHAVELVVKPKGPNLLHDTRSGHAPADH